jgi:hypothetical protein
VSVLEGACVGGRFSLLLVLYTLFLMKITCSFLAPSRKKERCNCTGLSYNIIFKITIKEASEVNTYMHMLSYQGEKE